MPSTSDPRAARALTTLDRIGVVLALLLTLGLLGVPLVGASFAATYAELEAELPWLTRAALSWWFPLVWAAGALVAIAWALRGNAPLARRRLGIVLAFVVASLGLAVCIVALYLPLFALADAASPG